MQISMMEHAAISFITEECFRRLSLIKEQIDEKLYTLCSVAIEFGVLNLEYISLPILIDKREKLVLLVKDEFIKYAVNRAKEEGDSNFDLASALIRFESKIS